MPRPFPSTARPLVRIALATTAGLGLLAAAPPADAHVRVAADSTATGSFSALTFRVPNESDTAGTVKVRIELPQDRPLLYVSAKPVPGWTVRIVQAPLPKPVQFEGTTITKAVRTVTWTATPGHAIAPGQYDEFAISAGPLPAPGALVLPAMQTYSDGSVVRWDEPSTPGTEEPEHPAPEFQVTAAGAGERGGEAAAAPGPAAKSDPYARGLAGGALALALVGSLLAAYALRRRPTRAPEPGRQ